MMTTENNNKQNSVNKKNLRTESQQVLFKTYIFPESKQKIEIRQANNLSSTETVIPGHFFTL